jgi:hypothetical protein
MIVLAAIVVLVALVLVWRSYRAPAVPRKTAKTDSSGYDEFSVGFDDDVKPNMSPSSPSQKPRKAPRYAGGSTARDTDYPSPVFPGYMIGDTSTSGYDGSHHSGSHHGQSSDSHHSGGYDGGHHGGGFSSDSSGGGYSGDSGSSGGGSDGGSCG